MLVKGINHREMNYSFLLLLSIIFLILQCCIKLTICEESLFAFGTYNYGELGIGDNSPVIPYPIDKPFPFEIKDISIGRAHVMFLTTTGEVYSIGSPDYGQFGNGLVTSTRSGIPSKFQINGTAVKVSTIVNNAFVLTNTGEVYASGRNRYGELGNGILGDVSLPVRAFSGLNVTDVQGGTQITTVLTDKNELYSVGINSWGQFGDDSPLNANSTTPVKATIGPVKSYRVCNSLTVAETIDGKFYVFGFLGVNYKLPVEITELAGLNISERTDLVGKVVKIISDNMKALTEDNILFNIGTIPATPISLKFVKSNTKIEKIFSSRYSFTLDYYLANDTSCYMSIGDPYDNILGTSGTNFGYYPLNITSYHSYFPYKIISASKILSATSFISNNNTIYTTGRNDNALLGTGSSDFAFTYSPIDISNEIFKNKIIKEISMGYRHSLVLTDNGEVYAFGDNSQVSSLNVTSVSAGNDYSLFLTNTGEIYSCGRGENGQLGNGFAVNNKTLTKVVNLDGFNISAVYAGGVTSFVLTVEGEIYGFGANSYKMLGSASSLIPVKVSIPDNPKIIKISHSTNNVGFLTDRGEAYLIGATTGNIFTKISLGEKKIRDISLGSTQFFFLTESGELYSRGGNNYGELGIGPISAGTKVYRVPMYFKINRVEAGQSHIFIIVSENEFLCDNNCYGNGHVFVMKDMVHMTANITNYLVPEIMINGKLEGTEKITTFLISVDISNNNINTSSIVFNYFIPNIFNYSNESPKQEFTMQAKGKYELTVTLYSKERKDFIHGNKIINIDVFEFTSNSISDDLSLNDIFEITKNNDIFNNKNNTAIIQQLVSITTKENVKNVEQGKKVLQIYESITKQSDIPINTNVTSQISQISNIMLKFKKNNNVTDEQVDLSVTSIFNILDNILQQTNSSVNASQITHANEIKKDTEQAIQTSLSLLSLTSTIDKKRIEGKAMDLLFTRISSKEETILNITSEYQFKVPNDNGINSNNISYGAVRISDNQLYQTSETKLSNVFQLKTFVNGDYIPLRNLQNPIIISFKLEKSDISFNNSVIYSCKYYNETLKEWRSDGCKSTGISILNDSSIVMNCECDHTTSFLTFLEFSSKSNETSISQLVLSSIYLALIILIFIGLLTFRKDPIIKSRFLTPYIGLSAIFVDNLFSGIISNAIFQQTKIFTTSTTISSADILGNVALIISTMMTLIAIEIYLIESIRYLLIRYLYELLNENPKLERKFLLKIFTSKLIYIISCLIIGIPVIIYFVIFVILRRFNIISALTFSSITSITYFLLIILFSIVILTVYLIDIYFTKRYKQYSNELSEMMMKQRESSNTSITPTSPFKENNKKLIRNNENYQNIFKNFFIHNDTLLFRSEACIFLFGLIFFIISFCIGFSLLTKEDSQKGQLSEVILAFDLIRTILWIALFGGYSVCVLIYKRCKSKKDKTQIKDVKKDNDELSYILKQPEIFSLFKQYAKQEFSLENIYAFVDLEYIKELRDNKNQLDTIWNELERFKIKYLESNATMELNVSFELKKRVNLFMNERKDVNGLIEEIESALVINLGDTYSRFIETEEYLLIEKTSELKEQIKIIK
ncbi:hypothetical protein ABK040_012252 [Willaertia magna]